MEVLDSPERNVKARLDRFFHYLNTPLPCYICQHYSYIHECRSFTNVEHLHLFASLTCHHIGILGLLRRLAFNHRVYSKLLLDNVDNSEQCCDVKCLTSLRQSLVDKSLPYGFDRDETISGLDTLIQSSQLVEETDDHQYEDLPTSDMAPIIGSILAEHPPSILWAHAADEFGSPLASTDRRDSGLHRSWLFTPDSDFYLWFVSLKVTLLIRGRPFAVYSSPRPPELDFSKPALSTSLVCLWRLSPFTPYLRSFPLDTWVLRRRLVIIRSLATSPRHCACATIQMENC